MFRKQDFKKIDLLGSGKHESQSNSNFRQEKYKDIQS